MQGLLESGGVKKDGILENRCTYVVTVRETTLGCQTHKAQAGTDIHSGQDGRVR